MGAITGLLGGGQKMQQAAIRPIAPPSRSDSEVQAAALKERNQRRALLGRAGTNPTGDTGDTSAAPVSRAILGGRQAAGA